MKAYEGAISNGCLQLIAEEWDERPDKGKAFTVMVFDGFEDTFNVHKFAHGFSIDDKPHFRQATIIELLSAGVVDPKLGLNEFVYCLGSAYINPKEKIACGMISPGLYYPGLESMDGDRQMLSRAIECPWSSDTRVALVKLGS